MKHSPEEIIHHTQAKALLNDIEGAHATAIPRRDTIVSWLNTYLARTNQTGYVSNDGEVRDLTALDQFLRSCAVPVAGGSTA